MFNINANAGNVAFCSDAGKKLHDAIVKNTLREEKNLPKLLKATDTFAKSLPEGPLDHQDSMNLELFKSLVPTNFPDHPIVLKILGMLEKVLEKHPLAESMQKYYDAHEPPETDIAPERKKSSVDKYNERMALKEKEKEVEKNKDKE
jgi:hypothetical protein